MKLLLDESLPRRLKKDLAKFHVKTVQDMNWSGKSNGELLSLAADNFNVLITTDQNIEYQQTLASYDIAIVVLAAKSNRYEDLKQLLPLLSKRLNNLTPGEVERISINHPE